MGSAYDFANRDVAQEKETARELEKCLHREDQSEIEAKNCKLRQQVAELEQITSHVHTKQKQSAE